MLQDHNAVFVRALVNIAGTEAAAARGAAQAKGLQVSWSGCKKKTVLLPSRGKASSCLIHSFVFLLIPHTVHRDPNVTMGANCDW